MLRCLILLFALLGGVHAWALTPEQAGKIAAGDSDDRVAALNEAVFPLYIVHQTLIIAGAVAPVSYTHLTLPTNREV